MYNESRMMVLKLTAVDNWLFVVCFRKMSRIKNLGKGSDFSLIKLKATEDHRYFNKNALNQRKAIVAAGSRFFSWMAGK